MTYRQTYLDFFSIRYLHFVLTSCSIIYASVVEPANHYPVKSSISCCLPGLCSRVAASIHSCIEKGPWCVHVSGWGGSLETCCEMNCTLPEQWCNPFVLSSVMWWVDGCTVSCSGASPSVMGTLFCCTASAYLSKKVRKNWSFTVQLQAGNKTYRKYFTETHKDY